jgi:hypothetical protein
LLKERQHDAAALQPDWRKTLRLTDFSTLTFDCYGTLIDWESGIMAGLKPLTDQLDGRLDRDASSAGACPSGINAAAHNAVDAV